MHKQFYAVRLFFISLLLSVGIGMTANGQAGSCGVVYQSTASTPNGAPPTYSYNYIRTLNTTNGTAGTTTIFTPSGPCYNIINGTPVSTTAGTVLTDAEAMGYDRNSNRIYFINKTTNNPAQELCYINLNASPVAAYKYVGYPLETNTAAGYNIDRMTFGSDGSGYALTTNGQDLIRFSVDPSTNLPVISRLGPLINDVTNGANDVLAMNGGDMVADASGNLYLHAYNPDGNSLMYRINPATRLTTCLGELKNIVGNYNSLAADAAGNIFIGGAFRNVYKFDLSIWYSDNSIIGTTANVYKSGDYASCGFANLAPALQVTKQYSSGEYTIEVLNTGNITATHVKLYDAIPAGAYYVPGSTTMNGVAVPDNNGAMPFSVSGGSFITSLAEVSVGIVKPGDLGKIVIKFNVTTDPQTIICNQATVTYTDPSDHTVTVLSDDPAQSGDQNPTCFSTGAGGVVLNGNKTWRCPFTNATKVVAGDPVEYTIQVNNWGSLTPSDVKFYDAIPANSHYISGSTKMNGVTVPDIGGLMPFSISGGQLINTPGKPAGFVGPEPGVVTITFMVTTDLGKTVCNQGTLRYTQVTGSPMDVLTYPDYSGIPGALCFYSAPPALIATKTYNDLDRAKVLGVVSGDRIEYTIEVTNPEGINATGIKLYDAIPAFSQYQTGTTTMNGVAVADIAGVMPFAVAGGASINSPGQLPGVVSPGNGNKVVIKFLVKTNPNKQVCNQATVSITDASNNTINVVTDNPEQSGTEDATCFFSFGSVGRIAVNTVNDQSALQQAIESVQAQPNPFVNDLNLQIQLNTAETVQVRLFDLYGRTVFITFQKLGAGVNSLHLNVPSGLSKGIYVLEVKAGTNQVLQKKLLKQ